jgi:hypothetical protein
VIDDESLVKTRTNTCLSYTSAVPSYSVLTYTASPNYLIFFFVFKYKTTTYTFGLKPRSSANESSVLKKVFLNLS